MDNCVLSSVTGDIRVSGNLQLADVKTTSGDIHLSGTIHQVVVKTVTGDITAELQTMPDAKQLESVSGDIKVVLPENDGFTIQYKRMAGDLKSDFNLMTSLNSKSGNAVYRNGELRVYYYETISGDIKILRQKV